MKKVILCIVLLFMILPGATGCSKEEQQQEQNYTIDLIGSSSLMTTLGGGTFETKPGGEIVANNLKHGDSAMMSSIYLNPGEHVILKATAIILEGHAFGVMIGENNYTDSFKSGWFCVNADLDRKDSRIFGLGEGLAKKEIGGWYAVRKDRNLTTGKEVTVAMEIMPDNTIRAYYNGEEYTHDTLKFEGYTGGYPGIMTYLSNVRFLSATLTYVGKKEPRQTIDLLATNLLIYQSDDQVDQKGKFEKNEKGHLIANNLNCAYSALMSNILIKPNEHVILEATGIIQEGRFCGVMFGEADYNEPFKTGWFCVFLNTRRKESRIFGGAGNVSRSIGDGRAMIKDKNIVPGQKFHIALEILPNGTVRAYYNGIEYTDDLIMLKDFKGAYPGIVTDLANVEFHSVTLTYIGK